MNTFKTITFTHANVGIDHVAEFFIDEESYGPRLSPLKENGLVDGVMILSTCNRVEFYFNTNYSIDSEYLSQFFKTVYPNWSKARLAEVVTQTNVLSEEDAVRHLFNVASSLDSMVIGEREIITQFRKAYDNCCEAGLTNDFLRLVTRKTIETAKRVFTETEISNKPTSVVNLAARLLKSHNIAEDARVVVVGAGVTNQALLRQMSKSGYRNTFVYNRTLAKAVSLAETVNGVARPLSDLIHHQEGMDVLLTCTGAPGNIITPDLYDRLVGHDTNHKIVVDLAVPNDFDHTILHKHAATLIEVSSLKQIAEKNLESRKQHLDACNLIIDENLNEFKALEKERKVELAMRQVSEEVKAIKAKAIEEVFKKEIEGLETNSQELLNEVIDYLEKKYIAIPYKTAKEVLLNKKHYK